MIKRIKNSLAFRSPAFNKRILKCLPVPSSKTVKAITDEYVLVILCGATQTDMLNECLKSIYRSFKYLPHVHIFTDLNFDAEACRRAVKWFPSKLTVIPGAECLNYCIQNNKASVVGFARANPMGVKMAAILQMLDAGKPVQYCDTDVLWYKDPWPVLKGHLADTKFEMVMSADFQPAYDNNMLEESKLSILNEAPYFCAGIMLLKKLSDQSLAKLESLLAVAEKRSNHFSEQTIFACLNRAGNDLVLDAQQFMIKTDDQFNLMAKPLQGVIARHYIGPVRHLFWRDALWLR